jgi:YfiH family protein
VDGVGVEVGVAVIISPVHLLHSRLLSSFLHGFTTREGGVSLAPFAALNLGGSVGDDPAAVEENWGRLARETGLAFARVRQVHGDRVVRAQECAPGRPDAADRPEADAVLSRTPGVAALVAVADCVPILLADPRSGAVAAVHAGWRGTLAGIAARAVDALVAEGARAAELLAAIGPSIGPCCYEVSPDLAARFRAALGPDVANDLPSQPRLDLWRANERVLHRAGVPLRSIDLLGRCTACEPTHFYSHRRDAGRTGRQVGFVAPRPTCVP